MSPVKQVMVFNSDMEVSTGKMISQACHASLGAYKSAPEDSRSAWEEEGSKKVVLEAGDHDLEDLRNEAARMDLPNYLVRDAGLTEVEPGTVTVLGIGPAEESKIDTVTGELELIE